MVRGMAGSAGGYWGRTLTDGDVIQHPYSLFETGADARNAEAVVTTLRDMPEARAVFVSVDVCEIDDHA
jgi:hypothetical protein